MGQKLLSHRQEPTHWRVFFNANGNQARIRGYYSNDDTVDSCTHRPQAHPIGAGQSAARSEIPKRKKGKEKWEWKQKTKTKARSIQGPGALFPQLRDLGQSEVTWWGGVILGPAWGMGLRASHCSELGFLWWGGADSWAIFYLKLGSRERTN